MISYLKRGIKDKRMRILKEFSNGCWIKVINPNEEELEFLHKEFGLDKQNLISGLDDNEIPRVEFDDNKTYIFVKDMENQKIVTLLIVIDKNFILTLSKYNLEILDELEREEALTTQRLRMLVKSLSNLNKKFEIKTLEIVKEVKLSQEKFNSLRERDISNLLKYESLLDNFVFYYSHLIVLYNRILKKIKFYEKDKDILEDLITEVNESFNLAKTSLKAISNIRNHYMILLSNKLNRIITILTIVTIFISIPEAISGVYGMNILLPIQHNPNVFYYIMAIVLFIWVGLILYLRKELK